MRLLFLRRLFAKATQLGFGFGTRAPAPPRRDDPLLPGSRGGQYYRTDKGRVRYGDRPAPDLRSQLGFRLAPRSPVTDLRPAIEIVGGAHSGIYAGGFKAVGHADDQRIYLTFPRRLTKDEYSFVRQNGFLWSPTRNAFVRTFNAAGRYAAEAVVKHFAETFAEPIAKSLLTEREQLTQALWYCENEDIPAAGPEFLPALTAKRDALQARHAELTAQLGG